MQHANVMMLDDSLGVQSTGLQLQFCVFPEFMADKDFRSSDISYDALIRPQTFDIMMSSSPPCAFYIMVRHEFRAWVRWSSVVICCHPLLRST